MHIMIYEYTKKHPESRKVSSLHIQDYKERKRGRLSVNFAPIQYGAPKQRVQYTVQQTREAICSESTFIYRSIVRCHFNEIYTHSLSLSRGSTYQRTRSLS